MGRSLRFLASFLLPKLGTYDTFASPPSTTLRFSILPSGVDATLVLTGCECFACLFSSAGSSTLLISSSKSVPSRALSMIDHATGAVRFCLPWRRFDALWRRRLSGEANSLFMGTASTKSPRTSPVVRGEGEESFDDDTRGSLISVLLLFLRCGGSNICCVVFESGECQLLVFFLLRSSGLLKYDFRC